MATYRDQHGDDSYRRDSSPKHLNFDRKVPGQGSVGKSVDAPKVGTIEDVTNRQMVGNCKF
jgi:hypothetical protein